MGSTFSAEWTSVGALKAALRKEWFGEGGLVAECAGRAGRDSLWFVAARTKTAYEDLPVGTVIAMVVILHPPEGGYGAGFRELSELEGPYAVSGVTKAFLAALDPLPAGRGFDKARRWRASAAMAAEALDAAKSSRRAS